MARYFIRSLFRRPTLPCVFKATGRIIAPFVILVLLTSGAASQTRVWVAFDGAWGTPQNWSPAMTPNNTSDVEINNGGTAMLQSAATGAARDIYLGRTLLTDGGLEVSTGAQLTSRHAWIGHEGGGTALVSGVDSLWNIAGANLTVGNSSDLAKQGELQIVEGGTVTAFRTVIGSVDNSYGSVFVSGSTFNSGSLTIGQRGIGTLQINNGTVQSGTVKIGEFDDPDDVAFGEATLNGGTWNAGNFSFYVGDAGTGRLTINSGTLTTGSAYVGRQQGSDGDALVHGAWNINGLLAVGESGKGRLLVEDSGSLQSLSGQVGGFDSFGAPDGELVVDGTSWIISGFINILRNGRLEIADGELQVNGVFAGGNDPFQPTVRIDGTTLATRATVSLTNSTMTSAGLLLVGDNAFGKLTIGEGSTLTNPAGVLGFYSTGDAEVDVNGGTWNNTGKLTVGSGGKAKLIVRDGGLLTSNTSIIADDASSIATVIVDGFDSRWENTGTLQVGDTNGPGTQGTLIVRNGAEVTSTGNVSGLGKGVIAGDGTIVANVAHSATVDPGYVDESTGENVRGTLRIEGNYRQVTGKLKIDLGQFASDKLQATGNVELVPFFTNTVLDVALAGGFQPVAGNTFDILDWGGTISGTFTSMLLPALGAGLTWDTSQLYTTGVIAVAGPPGLAGDFSGDGKVDAADYVVWRNGLGTTHTLGQYYVWRANFGAGSGAASTSDRAVPEPATAALILLTGLCASLSPKLRTNRRP